MDKFEFDVDYQLDLLKYAIKDRDGFKVIKIFEPDYFTLNEHMVLADAIKRFYKTHKRVPRQPSIIQEELKHLFRTRDYAELLSKEERANALSTLKTLFTAEVKDGDLILKKCRDFVRYVEVKHTIENIDLLNFTHYSQFLSKIQRAIKKGDEAEHQHGTMLIKNIKERQFNRQDNSTVIPTPFRQINNATNAGGYDKGSIIVVLDRPKKFKSGMLINIARGYLRMKKKILIIDLENGEDAYAMRLEQSIVKKTKAELLSGKHDNAVQKILRKYKRLGGEVVIIRMPSLVTTTNDIQAEMDYYYQEHGIRFDELIVDYAALLGSTTGKLDDHNRIADAYLDLANLAVKNELEHVWTAHHVVKDAYTREKTRYTDGDLAKCTEIGRHVHAIWGLNRDQDEEENNIMRMELVTQRDGKPDARALFHIDLDAQRADEFTNQQLIEYNKLVTYNFNEEEEEKPRRKPKPKEI